MSNAQQIATAAKAATSKAVEITPYHRDVFKACETGRKAADTMLQRMVQLLKSKYGETSPTFAQYRGDQAALAQLAKDRGLVDNQWVRKPYAAAVKTLYGALPEAQTAAALAKRKVREALAASKGEKAGAVKGQTAPRRASEPETLEQYVARVGVFKVLAACAAILEADKSTADMAKAVKALKAA